jgi:hypothetical protein
MVELYLHSPICFHDIVLNYLRTGTILLLLTLVILVYPNESLDVNLAYFLEAMKTLHSIFVSFGDCGPHWHPSTYVI